jgi:hypothetical protein
MSKRSPFCWSLAALAVILLGATPAQASSRRVAGSWFAVVNVPPNPLLGNPVDIQFPELFTFDRGGGATSQSGLVGFPIPGPGGVLTPVLMSSGHASWKVSRTGRIRATDWRMLNDPATSANPLPVGFVKIRFEGRLVDRNRIQGEWVLDLFGPGGEGDPILVGGEPFQIGSTFEMTRLPVESLP